jgi:hypothetical protein
MMILEKHVAQHSVVYVGYATYMYIAFLATYCEVYVSSSPSLEYLPKEYVCRFLVSPLHNSDPCQAQIRPRPTD